MSDQQYYMPAPEDIRVGFECQVQVDVAAWEFAKVPAEGKVFDLCMVLIETNGIRVPYLTAEQIEAEGWKSECRTQWVKPHSEVATEIFFNYDALYHSGSFVKVYCGEAHQDIYQGTIRCINDLRQIVKLLGI